jgi:branched-subunit amino acid ABC-type transport system permease component
MSSSVSEALLFLALVINGGLAGAIYALIALAFVLVYKASRMINFALGEWIMFGALLTSTGSHAIGLGLGALCCSVAPAWLCSASGSMLWSSVDW